MISPLVLWIYDIFPKRSRFLLRVFLQAIQMSLVASRVVSVALEEQQWSFFILLTLESPYLIRANPYGVPKTLIIGD